jgi:uncharacterized membrane protein YdbT with pleckstrin-like domain
MNEEQEFRVLHPSTGRWLLGSFVGWFTIALCFLGIGIPLILFIWINRRFTTYRITNQRLILETGIVFRRIDEVELYRVKDVRVDFSLLNQLVDIGTITLASSDKTTRRAALRMKSVKNARKIREALRNLVEAARQRRGVREIDGMISEAGHFGHGIL